MLLLMGLLKCITEKTHKSLSGFSYDLNLITRKVTVKMQNISNLCQFEGRMVRDPQFSSFQANGNTVEKALFSIAVDRALSSAQRQKAKTDTNIKTADFIPCSLIGGQVPVLRQYFPIGKAIKVVGHYTEYKTTDQQTGQVKYGHIFELDSIGFVVQDGKNVQANTGGQQQAAPQQQQNYQQQAAPQQNYQQPVAQQPPVNNFAMFDENDSPF